MHLQIVQIVTFVIAFTLSATRVLNASKALWSLLPPVVSGALPSLVIAVPALSQAVVGAQSWTDLAVAFLVAGSLLLPGIHSHTVAMTKPNGPGSSIAGTALLLIGIGFALHLTGCGFFASKGVTWPTLAANCLPSPAKLVSQVEAILFAGGDYEKALEQQALTDGAGAVECAVAEATQALLASKGKVGASAQAGPAADRGKAFLAKVSAK